MLTDFEKGIICLARNGLTDKTADLPQGFDPTGVYSVAKKHQTRSLMLSGAMASGIDKQNPELQQLIKGTYHEISADERQRKKFIQMTELFEREGIEYMPLKGILLKELYPQPEMRTMGDIDILIRPEQQEKAAELLKTIGFDLVKESDHEYIWRTPDMMVTIEIHKFLIPSYNTAYFDLFSDGFALADRVEGFRYRLKKEYEYIFLFVHFAKHYRDGGIGIKHLADLWMYQNAYSPDEKFIETELEKVGLLSFYHNIQAVLKVWFEDGEPNEITEMISRVIVESGAYGLRERSVTASLLRRKAKDPNAKRNGVMKKLFLPYENMCMKYPYLKKYPILLPIAHAIRIIDALINKQDKIKAHATDIKATSNERVEEYERQLKQVGLEFNF